MPLPMRDMWRHLATVQRLTRTVDGEFRQVEEVQEILIDEPCAMSSVVRQVMESTGVVWRKVPRCSISPLDATQAPHIDDILVVDDRRYRVTDLVPYTDYDGSYMGSSLTLQEIGIEDADNPHR
jgi:hypothetical protein